MYGDLPLSSKISPDVQVLLVASFTPTLVEPRSTSVCLWNLSGQTMIQQLPGPSFTARSMRYTRHRHHCSLMQLLMKTCRVRDATAGPDQPQS